jgi:hypothetical protein
MRATASTVPNETNVDDNTLAEEFNLGPLYPDREILDTTHINKNNTSQKNEPKT